MECIIIQLLQKKAEKEKKNATNQRCDRKHAAKDRFKSNHINNHIKYKLQLYILIKSQRISA